METVLQTVHANVALVQQAVIGVVRRLAGAWRTARATTRSMAMMTDHAGFRRNVTLAANRQEVSDGRPPVS